MDRPLLLYSASTWLAHAIAERFYGGIHYVWCSPHFDGATAANYVNIPPTASPAEIYRNLADECRRGERHSEAFKRNRGGILHGAKMKREKGSSPRHGSRRSSRSWSRRPHGSSGPCSTSSRSTG